MIFESTPHFFNCHMWMFPFWMHLIAFFEINGGKLSVSPNRFFSMWRTRIPTVLLLCLSKEQRFFFLLKQLIILQKQRFSFLWKNRNIVLFVNSQQKRKAKESINKVSVELLIEQNQHGVNVKVVFKGFQITKSKLQKKEIKKTNKQTNKNQELKRKNKIIEKTPKKMRREGKKQNKKR